MLHALRAAARRFAPLSLAALVLVCGLAPASAASFNKTNLFIDDLAKGALNLSTDTIKVMLTNTAPTASNHCYSDVSGNELANGDGYTTGGATVSGTGLSNSSGTESFAASATTWTSNTGNMGPFQYVVYYDSNPLGNASAACKTILGWYNIGSATTLNGVNGDTFVATPQGGVLATLQ